jgi:protein-S-isoprenylcysteine O-methyltransferase Ste14/ubiquinone/menaquinone biosynthesis C-methylase UbiE
MFLPIILVFVFYNYYSFDLLVYAGWVLLVFSVVIIFLAGGEFRKKGGVSKGESIVHTTVLVDSGVYAVIRHPQYLGFISFVLALVLMSQHWLSVISGVLGSALFYKDVLREEQMSVEKFGDDYRRYMERVPRMNFLIGILRLLRHRKEQSQVRANKFMSKDLYSEIDLDRFRERLLKYTRKAFQLLPELEKPRILDVGCGSGVPTIALAKLSEGEVVGLDIDQTLLDELNRKTEREGLSNRVETRKCSMFEMDFPDESFDIIWAEGSISVIGFERGLKEWRRLLKPGGFLVIHSETRKMLDKPKKVPSLGYKLLNHFSLPEDAHWTEYYRPLEIRVKELRAKYKSNPGALRILRKHQNEIDMVKRNPRKYSSAFYVMQKI